MPFLERLGLLGLLIACCIAPAMAEDAPNTDAATAALQRAQAALAPHSNGFWIDKSPGSVQLLKAEWTAYENWATDYFRTHPIASPRDLAAALNGVPDNIHLNVEMLDIDSLVVSVVEGEIGTVFLLANRGRGFEVVWRIADSAAHAPKGFRLLEAWRPECARRWCGPIFGNAFQLPSDRFGNRRFYISGTYAQGMGATVGGQMSLWRWDGRNVVPLLVKAYAYMVDQDWIDRLDDDDTLHVNIKDSFKSFYACGSCEGRQLDWSVKILPDRVQDLGERSIVPELDQIDALFTALLAGRPISAIAEPSVAAVFRKSVDAAKAAGRANHYSPTMGMFGSTAVTRRGDVKRLCFGTDKMGNFEFTLSADPAHPRILSARDLGGAGCDD